MEQTVSRYRDDDLSPYRVFSEDQWARLRADTPMTLTASEVARLQSLNDPVSIAQVESILLPLSRLLAYYVEATQQLHRATNRFLGSNEVKNPFVIGLAGSVAVGKSTTARLLQALLARWPASPKVDLVTTDGFLHPNAVLEREGLMRRKGFPESYDRTTLLTFLSDLKAGRRHVRAPVYSHFYYDVMPDQYVTVDRPDILILEGLNVLQTSNLPRDGKEVPFVSDFFDFSIYIDAEEDVLHDWYVSRFMRLRETAFRDPGSYFNKYALTRDEDALEIAEDLWREINLLNLQDNILPTRPRADLILHKARNHTIDEVRLRKL
jgi:type I pantothenate kinase